MWGPLCFHPHSCMCNFACSISIAGNINIWPCHSPGTPTQPFAKLLRVPSEQEFLMLFLLCRFESTGHISFFPAKNKSDGKRCWWMNLAHDMRNFWQIGCSEHAFWICDHLQSLSLFYESSGAEYMLTLCAHEPKSHTKTHRGRTQGKRVRIKRASKQQKSRAAKRLHSSTL